MFVTMPGVSAPVMSRHHFDLDEPNWKMQPGVQLLTDRRKPDAPAQTFYWLTDKIETPRKVELYAGNGLTGTSNESSRLIEQFQKIESWQGTGKQMSKNGIANEWRKGAASLEEVHPGFKLALTTPVGSRGRVVRGFARIGAAFQVLVCIVGVAIAALAEWHQYNDTNYDYDRYACLLDHTGGHSLAADTFKAAAMTHLECGNFSDYDNYSILEWGNIPGGGTTRKRIWVNGTYINYIPDQQLMWQTAKYVLGVLVATWIIGMIVYWVWVGLGWVLGGFFHD